MRDVLIEVVREAQKVAKLKSDLTSHGLETRTLAPVEQQLDSEREQEELKRQWEMLERQQQMLQLEREQQQQQLREQILQQHREQQLLQQQQEREQQQDRNHSPPSPSIRPTVIVTKG